MIGQLAKKFGGLELELEVLQSDSGFYIGTFYRNPAEFGPFSRESVEYFSCLEEAKHALENNTWTQRTIP